MAAETDLKMLLRDISPRLNEGRYVYTRIATGVPVPTDPVVTVREVGGLTLIICQEQADKLGLAYDFVAAWITLEVHSSLDAVGLTAEVSRALAAEGISANVVAGYAHDHLFVPFRRAGDAMQCLAALSTQWLDRR